MSRRLTLTMAIACGVAVANLYYAQPLLDAIAASLHVGAGAAAAVVTLSQIGYAAGLVLLVPLGDLHERRRLIVLTTLICVVGLAVAAVAPSLVTLALILAVVGFSSTVAQMLVPLAAELAAPEERGRVVGTVMSGLLLGILSARTVSGLVAGVAGWRVMYAVAAAAMLLVSGALWRELPVSHGRSELGYGALLRSVGTLFLREGGLRRRMVYGALGMTGFSAFWTALTLLLSDPPYDYGEVTIGLFGLLGIAGAASAQLSGRLADAGRLHAGTGFFLAAIVVSWLILEIDELWALMLGIVVFDLGIQGAHIANQNTIYAALPEARSRVTTAYMTGNFICAAIGSAAGAAAYDAGGWDALCGLGGAFAVVALVVWAQEQLARRRSVEVDRAPDLEGRSPGADVI